MTDRRSALELVLARDRIPVLAAIAGMTALAWAYLVLMAGGMHGTMRGGMPDMPGMAHGTVHPRSWTAAHFAMMLGMWAVMMVGMMLPAAAPMILFFATFARRSREQGHRVAPVGAFVSGYLAVWSAFALLATTLQWALDRAALLSLHMAAISPVLGGAVLVAAGLYQWTPLKRACLSFCRSPVAFVVGHWRTGTGGAFRMGVEHGAFCVGLLLGADGTAVRGRGDEPALGGRHHAGCPGREAGPEGGVDRPGDRHRTGARGRLGHGRRGRARPRRARVVQASLGRVRSLPLTVPRAAEQRFPAGKPNGAARRGASTPPGARQPLASCRAGREREEGP